MKNSPRGLRVIVSLALVLAIVMALGAGAATEPATSLKVATVDPARLLNEYDGTRLANDTIRKAVERYQAVLTSMKENDLLSEAEQNQLVLIMLQTGELSAADLKTKTDLIAKNQKLVDEYKTLQTVATADAAQTDRLNAFRKLSADTDTRLQLKQSEYKDKLDLMRTTNTASVVKQVKTAIAVRAKKEGINLVFSNELVWYADVDMTEGVLKDLNKR